MTDYDSMTIEELRRAEDFLIRLCAGSEKRCDADNDLDDIRAAIARKEAEHD